MLYRLLIYLSVLLSSAAVEARGVYQHPDAFLASIFNQQVPKPAFIWFTGELATQVTEILGHKPTGLRTRYWRRGGQTVWILEEIGKEKNITAGFVVQSNHIEKVKVLIFRESRGWEIKRDDFTRQFKQAGLDKKLQLNKPIDGISGATLSVSAITRLSRLSLYLHQQVMKKHHEQNPR